MKRILITLCLLLAGLEMDAQTAVSLFRRSDSLQVKKIVSGEAVIYNSVGHHGPAVENKYCAMRILFNNSGAIDVYSKSGKQMELLKYLWYPTEEQQAREGAGSDEYRPGKTLGCGGIALWDSENRCEVKLVAKARIARVGRTKNGSFAELMAFEIPYMGRNVDVMIRVDMYDDSREATITAREISGKKVQFVTGINYYKGQEVHMGNNWISVWGAHPADPPQHPFPIGVGMRFKPGQMVSYPHMTQDFVQIISLPRREIKTTVVVASNKESEINTAAKFLAYISKQ